MTVEPPTTSALYADHIALDLSQVEVTDQLDPWPIPDGVSGATIVTSGISDGEVLDPPQVTVHVYSGMIFADTHETRRVTFRDATWMSHRVDPEKPYSTPMDAIRCRFEEPADPDDPHSGPLELTGLELARYVASGRYENVTGEGY